MSDSALSEMVTLIRARTPLVWITTDEELRAERALTGAAGQTRLRVLFWDAAAGVTDSDGAWYTPSPQGVQRQDGAPNGQIALANPQIALRSIVTEGEAGVPTLWILRDLTPWLVQPPTTARLARNVARTVARLPRQQCVVCLSPQGTQMPADLRPHATPLAWALPDRAEVGRILDAVVGATIQGTEARAAVATGAERERLQSVLAGLKASVDNGGREAAIDAAVGLPAAEVAACYSRSLVECSAIDPQRVMEAKKAAINGIDGLTWHDPDPRGLDAIGGLGALKTWLRQRERGFSAEARAYGLPAPKGILLGGLPGTGKSLTAKAVGTAWGMPLIRLDMGAVKGSLMGESEAKIRRALEIAERVSPCILWVDEVEKALSGATGSGAADGGVAADALGTLLSWMQDRSGSVFVVATANDVEAMPAEFTRKGRFDEVFALDLPTESERREIARVGLTLHGRDADAFDLDWIAGATEGFVGAEIVALVPTAMFTAFYEGREVTTEDVVAEAKATTPLSVASGERIERIRAWAKGKARNASDAGEEVVSAAKVAQDYGTALAL